jgi:hypothetical protein
LDDRRFLFSIKSLPSTTSPVVNIPLTCSARSPLHRTAASQAVGRPTETPATPPTLSPVSGGEGVIPSPAWAGEGKGEGGKVSQDFCNS